MLKCQKKTICVTGGNNTGLKWYIQQAKADDENVVLWKPSNK